MPEGFAPCTCPREIEGLPLSPRLCTVTGLHPRKPVYIDALGRHPLVMRRRGMALERPRDTVACHQVLGIKPTIKLYTPVKQFVRFIDAMLQPVQALRIAGKVARWLYISPLCEAGTMPGPAYRIQRAILGFEPLAKLLLARLAKAIRLPRPAAVVGRFVP